MTTNIVNYRGFLNSNSFEELLQNFYHRLWTPVLSLPEHIDDKCSAEYIKVSNLDLENKKFGVSGDFIYQHNKYHFRDKDFVPNTNILCFGCSVTYGIGVPIEHRWTDIVSKNLGLISNNYGIPGLSTSQITLMYLGLLKFVRPKYAVFLVPDYNRELLSKFDSKGNISYFQTWSNYDICIEKETRLEDFEISKNYYSLPISWHLDRFVNDIHTICLMSEQLGIKTLIGSWSSTSHNILQDIEISNFKNCHLIDYLEPDKKGRDQDHPGIVYHHTLADIVSKNIAEV